MKISSLLAAAFLAFAGPFFWPEKLAAQPVSLADGLPFFQERKAVFSRWLDASGLSEVLAVDYLRLKSDDETRLELHLKILTTDQDTAEAMWSRAKKHFAEIEEKPLAEALFERFVGLMEIPSAQGELQIQFRNPQNRLSDASCFWIKIDQKGEKAALLELFGPCRAQRFDIPFSKNFVKKSVNGRQTTVSRRMPASEVFDSLTTFFQRRFPPNKYEKTDCSGRRPEVLIKKKDDATLVLIVNDLCREVLLESENSIWCAVARRWDARSDCNDMRRERLEFKFGYSILENGGFKLTVDLDGKVGSAHYKPQCEGWKSMTVDFRNFEAAFSEKLEGELKKLLQK